ncbi:MAG: hypothetical protein M3301_06095 [Chloroflexota bacterium]|nr:hypothetical protein [Chloroflexota bacterium]
MHPATAALALALVPVALIVLCIGWRLIVELPPLFDSGNRRGERATADA